MAKLSSSRQSDSARTRRADTAFLWRPGSGSAAMLILLFLLGGSARGDVSTLIVLRPVAALLLTWAVWRMTRAGFAFVNVPFLIVFAFTVLCVLHLIPLPPTIWQSLPDRQLVTDISAAMGLANDWRPLSVAPVTTWNALLSTVPIIALILIVASERERYHALLPLLIGIASVGAILGGLQMASPPGSLLYPYRFSSFGSPIGFFANRNHQAVFLACMIPGAFAWALLNHDRTLRRVMLFGAFAFSALGLVLLAIIGSRAGLLLGGLAVVFSLWLVHRFGGGLAQYGRRVWVLAGVVVAGLATTTLLLGRGEAVSRIAETSYQNEARLSFWKPIVDLGAANFPFGTGLGSFVEAYTASENDRFLQPNYLNHAHNDWIEAFMTGGLPMVLILLGVIVFVAAQLPALMKAGRDDGPAVLGWLGIAWLVFLAIASVFDYPLRTPALSGVAAIGLIWLNAFRLSQRPREASLDGMDA
ncbi:O-antigen ligase family protein [Sphingopyxis sp.]|uniref:O-antigen ligase family protein n=1 Tax=Sphingopyxis sp. TaxID=1908224 RepID=UPI003BAD4536